MTTSFQRAQFRAVTTVLALGVGSVGLLYGSPVTVSGGFTGYNGYVGGCNAAIQTYLNGQNVTASSGCDSTSSAPYSTTFASTQSVDFYGTFNGSSLGDNLIQFTPAGTQEVSGLFQEFQLGTITYTNGSWFGTSADFTLSLTTESSDFTLSGSAFNGTVHLNITPNDFVQNTPQQNADCLSFTGYEGLGQFCVYELPGSPTGTNTGQVKLYGMIDALVPTRLDNATDGGFVVSSTPEPVSVVLTGTGLGLLALVRRRAR